MEGKPALGIHGHDAAEGLGIAILAEMYHVMRMVYRTGNDEIRTVFAQWNAGDMADPLLAATADALGLMDEDGLPLVEKVLDAGRATGACSEAAALALETGVPAAMISMAACAQAAASRKDERVAASAVLGEPKAAPTGDRTTMVEELRKAYCAAAILAAAEMHLLLDAASERLSIGLDQVLAVKLGAGQGLAGLLERASEAVARSGGRTSILLDASVKMALDQNLPSLRRIVSRSMEGGIPLPVLSAALSSYDSQRSTWLPANLVNALRDSLHGTGFERIDRPRGEVFHSDWK